MQKQCLQNLTTKHEVQYKKLEAELDIKKFEFKNLEQRNHNTTFQGSSMLHSYKKEMGQFYTFIPDVTMMSILMWDQVSSRLHHALYVCVDSHTMI
jgi:hypothetical protein